MGMIFLVGGSISDLAIPIFIGWVIDAINDNDYDRVGNLCLYMIIVVVVSQINLNPSHISQNLVNGSCFNALFLFV